MVTNIIIDGVNYTKNAVLPIKWGGLLDERLDEGHLSLKSVAKNIFEPLTPVELSLGITAKPQTETCDFVVASDEASENPPGSGQYDHELTLIEPTKLLERIPCETLSFQNSLGRTYTYDAVPAEPVYE